VSTTPGNPHNLLEFEIAPGNTGNLMEFSCCLWKILLIKVKYTDIAKFAGHLPHRYGNSRAIWDHTVLPATRQR